MKYTTPIFMDPKQFRNGTANVYRGGGIFTHVMGHAFETHDKAVNCGSMGVSRPVLYRINVKVKHVEPIT